MNVAATSQESHAQSCVTQWTNKLYEKSSTVSQWHQTTPFSVRTAQHPQIADLLVLHLRKSRVTQREADGTGRARQIRRDLTYNHSPKQPNIPLNRVI